MVKTRIREKDGTDAISCSSSGVYTVGEALGGARRNFQEALGLHLSAIGEKAIEAVAG